MHLFRPTSEKMIICIGSERSIEKLRKFEHHKKVENVVDFLINNGIYCAVSCDSGKDEDVIPMEYLTRLADNDLLVSAELAVEAFILSDKEKTYSGLDFLEMTKEEVDEIFTKSWWLSIFEI